MPIARPSGTAIRSPTPVPRTRWRCAARRRSCSQGPDAVLVCDGGEFGQWAQACMQAPQRVINGPAGSIGSALPFAAAAKLAFPAAPVVAMLGDGTFGFHLSEIDTAVRRGLAYVAVIGNDACWNAEYQIALRDLRRRSARTASTCCRRATARWPPPWARTAKTCLPSSQLPRRSRARGAGEQTGLRQRDDRARRSAALLKPAYWRMPSVPTSLS